MLIALCSAFFGTGRMKNSRTARTEEDAERPELPLQVGPGALLDRLGDLLHLVGALGRREHLAYQVLGEQERHERDAEDEPRARFSTDPKTALIGPLSWASQPSMEPPTFGNRTSSAPARAAQGAGTAEDTRAFGALTCDDPTRCPHEPNLSRAARACRPNMPRASGQRRLPPRTRRSRAGCRAGPPPAAATPPGRPTTQRTARP